MVFAILVVANALSVGDVIDGTEYILAMASDGVKDVYYIASHGIDGERKLYRAGVSGFVITHSLPFSFIFSNELSFVNYSERIIKMGKDSGHSDTNI